MAFSKTPRKTKHTYPIFAIVWVCWGSGTALGRKEWKMQLNHPSTATRLISSRAHSARLAMQFANPKKRGRELFVFVVVCFTVVF
jgi:Na+/glutamate symporter